jgi:hypothetical protein
MGVARMNELDFTRGTRDYLRAADLLKAAPLSADLLKFEMRFLKPGHHAGAWLSSSSSEIPENAVARLIIRRPQHSETWIFVPNTTVRKLQRIEDLDEDEIVAPGQLLNGRYQAVLTNRAEFWDQLIAQIRMGGEQVKPGRRWYVASITAVRWPLPQELYSHLLSISIQRERAIFLNLTVNLDDKPFGNVLLREIEGGSERV